MSSRHHRRSYRIIAILLAFLFIGAAVFVPIAASPDPNLILLWILLGIWAVALVTTIVVNEIIIAKKYGGDFLKKKDEEEDE